ncbi:MAG TPA: hypothetical protein VGP80_03040 [Gemmatimonadales bacterium]|nr:hypothetical protein [Gemmatimonadales bacterium]
MRVLNLIRAVGRRVLPVTLVLAAVSCDAGLKENSFGPISDLITGVATVDGTVTATLVAGSRPADGSGPTITVQGVPTAINGGSLRASVTSPTPFSRVIVSLTYFDGYYQLDLPAPVTSVDIVLNMSPNAPQAAMGFVYGAGAQGGPMGPSLTQNINLLRVGSGDVQVSVAWDAPTDVDLHVTDPSGEEIFFAHKNSASGGTLDLDSNPACSIDNINNENVVWPTGSAPSGTYSVDLVYWSACSQPQSNYTVTVVVAGQQPQVFSGTLVTSNSSVKIPIGTFIR